MVLLASRRLAPIGGVLLLILGGVLAGILLLTTPFVGCTDIGVSEGANTGFEFVGIENGNIVYSPDGANVCQTPLQVVTIPLVPGASGLLLFMYSRYGDDQPGAGSDDLAGD